MQFHFFYPVLRFTQQKQQQNSKTLFVVFVLTHFTNCKEKKVVEHVARLPLPMSSWTMMIMMMCPCALVIFSLNRTKIQKCVSKSNAITQMAKTFSIPSSQLSMRKCYLLEIMIAWSFSVDILCPVYLRNLAWFLLYPCKCIEKHKKNNNGTECSRTIVFLEWQNHNSQRILVYLFKIMFSPRWCLSATRMCIIHVLFPDIEHILQ